MGVGRIARCRILETQTLSSYNRIQMEENETPRIYKIFDRFGRLFGSDPDLVRDICRTNLKPETVAAIDLAKLKRDETALIDTRLAEHVADLLYYAPLRTGNSGSRVMILTEHKSRPDPYVLLQMGIYMMLAWGREWDDLKRSRSHKLSAPILIILYHGPRPWNGPRNFSELVEMLPGMEDCVPRFGFHLIDLAATPVEEIRGNAITRAALEAMKRASNGTLAEGFRSVISHFQSEPLTEKNLEWLNNVAYFSVNAGSVPKKTVKSSLELVLSENEVNNMVESFLMEAEARGEARGEIRAILTFLQSRFGPVPESIRGKLSVITDAERLERLAAKVGTVQSLDEFAEALQ